MSCRHIWGKRKMRELNFFVKGQKLEKDKKCNFDGIVKGTSGYLRCSFSFSREWTGKNVAAQFWCLGNEYAAPVINGICNIPDDALVWNNFQLNLVGKDKNQKIVTNKVTIRQEG